MLSGIKFIPRDQLISTNSDSDEDLKNSQKKDKRDKRKKKDRRRRRRRNEEYSSDSDEESDSSQSGSESEEDRRSKVKKGGRKKERSLQSSDEHEKRRGRKKKRKDFSDNDGGEVLQNEKEQARKEAGLEWMLNSGSRSDSRTVKNESEPEKPQGEEVIRTNPRELNPYLKDHGSGYPEDAPSSQAGPGQLLSSSVVGDGGASWRLKALKRAKEQAAREGRKLDEVVEERWGSLGQLAVTLTGQRAAPVHAHLHAIKDRRRGGTENSESAEGKEVQKDGEDFRRAPRDYLRDVSARHPEMKKPREDSLHWKRSKKTNISSVGRSLISAAISGINKFADDGSYMESISRLQNKHEDVVDSSHVGKEANDHIENDTEASKGRNLVEVSSITTQGLTPNQLAAKVLQLRMKGKHVEAEQLSKVMETVIDAPSEKNIASQETKGTPSRYIEKQISSERNKREEDADLHLAQSIMRNKKYSMSSSTRADDEYDYDGDAPSRKRNRKRQEVKHENINIPKRILTQQERCQFCFENPSRPKHLVVSIGNFTYMMLPQWQPVVQGHCCIVPMQHDSSTRSVDKNVWEELRNFKKCLLRMFAEQEKDVLFIETVIGLSRQRRHCLIECIPVPYAVANQAPMYFKKAIDEAEDEWGQHEMKKVIPTSGNLHNVIPENLAYFHVEFGLDRGFVHVIDDDANFTSNFGLNIVRGMLRLPEEDMHRRRRQESVENQMLAVASFLKDWEPFDWTKDLD